ncbi:alpha/beta fold hydrolase [Rhizobium miluonense]|uniref:TAP-like protein n=1 Tax=Rhizobium miluonense TaxID=411945 RepID=A0A1C3WE29_9HYPH|nr:alpha/beta hydrolase [Rhizobium miluonense]SCB37954.1 hypothetical protein GA0061102_102733 [Rhizobium miluonense]
MSEFERRGAADALAGSREMVERQLRYGFKSELEWRIGKFALAGPYRKGVSAEEALAVAADPSRKIDIKVHKRLWMGTDFDVRPQISGLTSKLLAISGELDWLVPPSNKDELLSLKLDARYFVVPSVAHNAHYAARQIVLNEIEDFLSS